jgi:hypothetical protein
MYSGACSASDARDGNAPLFGLGTSFPAGWVGSAGDSDASLRHQPLDIGRATRWSATRPQNAS